MTLQDAHPPLTARRPRTSGNGLFRAFWRWHFFASFVVIPILLVLAVTGAIYLFRFQLEPLMHADLMKVDRPEAATVQAPFTQQQEAVEAAFPDATIATVSEPASPHRSTDFVVSMPDGSSRDVYVDPWTGEVLGSLDPDKTLSGLAIGLHRDLMLGTTGDRVIELSVCWAIVMALTGYYLFFKGRIARMRRRAAGAAGAALRSRHGTIGAVAGVGILMLVVSGLPWTGFWGEHAQSVATKGSTSMWSLDPGAQSVPGSTLDESLPHSHSQEIPWAQGKTVVPKSNEPSPGAQVSVANVDTALAVADREGLRHPVTVVMPSGDRGVFSAMGYAFNDPSREKTVHIDRFGGQVVSTYGFADYPALAKIVSQGIGLHEGRSFGIVSMIGSALMCALIVVLCVSGPLMWWRRRPKGAGSVGAPRGRLPLGAMPVLAVLVAALAVFLPLFGASLVIVLVLDQLVLRRVGRLGAWFNVVTT